MNSKRSISSVETGDIPSGELLVRDERGWVVPSWIVYKEVPPHLLSFEEDTASNDYHTAFWNWCVEVGAENLKEYKKVYPAPQILARTFYTSAEQWPEWRQMLQKAVDNAPDDFLKYDQADLALPPWEVVPVYGRYSMGWRMGSGEDYWHAFSDWYSELPIDDQSDYRIAYPAPGGWDDFYQVLSKR